MDFELNRREEEEEERRIIANENEMLTKLKLKAYF
jgi:hypothetical protein